ncbi:coagulation factor XII [Bombina bombina]|uniref:coagulation factor XII n=1 Tax=Bombina bombina TaxID=8345 RepID=UPI00235AB724|nr:coagulation factor XII [Bombina bombina]
MKLFSALSLLALLIVAQTREKHKEKKRKSGLVLTESGHLCHFPFHYGRAMYNSCIRKGKHGPKAWCSLTKNYDRDQRWSYCIEGHDVKDYCDDNPCEARGVCENKLKGYECICKEPYTGRHCQIDKCFDKKLLRYFEPKEKWLRYSPPKLEECVCHEKSITCKTTTGKECLHSPCLNGGHCIQTKKNTVCGCTQGYSGLYCEIRQNEFCYTGNGSSYRGTSNVTVTGTPCLHWDSDIIQDLFEMYSDGQAKHSGLGDHPYCRNPVGDVQPWCYVLKEQRVSWEYCLISPCNQTAASISPPKVNETLHILNASNATSSKPEPTGAPNVQIDLSRGLGGNCGKRFRKSPSISPRIVGGLVALPASHPYIAALYIDNRFCGGSLISSCWVLTAAHCLYHRPHVTKISVVLGQSLYNTTDQYTSTFPVEKYILHELYNDETFQHDIALIKLKSGNEFCAAFSQFVQPVCLPEIHKTASATTKCEVAGWGHQYHDADQYAFFLQEAFVPIIPNSQCQDPEAHASRILPGMQCAGFMEGGIDACQGDSGGPLVCEVDGRVELHGIVSWGEGCGEENKPGVYTDVSNYIDWIIAKIR